MASVYVVGDERDTADVQVAVGPDVAVVRWVFNDDMLVNLVGMLAHDVVVFVNGWAFDADARRVHEVAVDNGLLVQYREKRS